MARITAPLALALASAVIAACDTAPETAAPPMDFDAAVVPAEQATNPDVLAGRITSFGGMFVDDAGRPTVYLTNLSEASRARQVLRDFANENGVSAAEIQFLPASFRFAQLNSWYDRTCCAPFRGSNRRR